MTSLDILLDTENEVDVIVYSKLGPYEGALDSLDPWNLVMETRVKGQGRDIPTLLDCFLEKVGIVLRVPANTRRSFYIKISADALRFGLGTRNEGSLASSNDDLFIYEGRIVSSNGLTSAVGGYVMLGNIRYSLDSTLMAPTSSPTTSPPSSSPSDLPSFAPTESMIPTVSLSPSTIPSSMPSRLNDCADSQQDLTTDLASNSWYSYDGFAFEVQTKSRPVFLLSIDTHLYVSSRVTIAVLTKDGSYLRNSLEVDEWTPVTKSTIISNGPGNLTPIECFEIPLAIEANSTQSFLVTVVNSNAYLVGSFSSDYSIYTQDANLQILSGG